MGLFCFLLGHDWSDWIYIKSVGRWDERLKRNCKRCKKHQNYTGPVEYNEKGEKVPFS